MNNKTHDFKYDIGNEFRVDDDYDWDYEYAVVWRRVYEYILGEQGDDLPYGYILKLRGTDDKIFIRCDSIDNVYEKIGDGTLEGHGTIETEYTSRDDLIHHPQDRLEYGGVEYDILYQLYDVDQDENLYGLHNYNTRTLDIVSEQKIADRFELTNKYDVGDVVSNPDTRDSFRILEVNTRENEAGEYLTYSLEDFETREQSERVIEDIDREYTVRRDMMVREYNQKVRYSQAEIMMMFGICDTDELEIDDVLSNAEYGVEIVNEAIQELDDSGVIERSEEKVQKLDWNLEHHHFPQYMIHR